MKYFEDKLFTSSFRLDYLNSISKFASFNYPIIDSGDEYINKLGYPLTMNNHEDIKVIKKELLSKEKDFSLYRYHFLILNEIKLSGLLFEVSKNEGLVIYQHGFLGTPEVIGAIYEDRNTSNYNDIVPRLIKLNKNVFCPQLLMWSIDNYGINYDRKEIDNQLRRANSSLISLETYLLKEVIHYFKKDNYPYIDMFGMSYGGYYTYQVSLVSDEIKRYWASSYLIPSYYFEETLFGIDFEKIYAKAINNHDFYISFGDEDPVIDYEKTYPFIKTLLNQNRIITYHGNHEVIKDDIFLKGLFE